MLLHECHKVCKGRLKILIGGQAPLPLLGFSNGLRDQLIQESMRRGRVDDHVNVSPCIRDLLCRCVGAVGIGEACVRVLAPKYPQQRDLDLLNLEVLGRRDPIARRRTAQVRQMLCSCKTERTAHAEPCDGNLRAASLFQVGHSLAQLPHSILKVEVVHQMVCLFSGDAQLALVQVGNKAPEASLLSDQCGLFLDCFSHTPPFL
mmetsp:Transcript_6026/g.10486  ORF Transcript_6026/g.10486 Transcript_6026/m.10486 type:complete len:204 (-) Transcript_6026:127-738(-)